MSSHLSPAETTAAALLEHRAAGPGVMIPGAFERRARVTAVPTTPAIEAIDMVVTLPRRSVATSDRGRLEREREGGGAPSQRAGRRRGTFMSRLWQSARHPTRLTAIWLRAQVA